MTKIIAFIKQPFVSVVFILLALFFIFYFQDSPKITQPTSQVSERPTNHNNEPKRNPAKKSPRLAKKSKRAVIADIKNDDDTTALEEFSYKKEKQRLEELGSQYPVSKQELMNIVVAEDVYKSKKVAPKEHSKAEITQNQRGAIKVMALRTLISRGQSPGEIQSNLQNIIDNAQDPTIKKIAEAALASANKGRPFFKDFLDAIEEEPL